jgi:hypothetical protein
VRSQQKPRSTQQRDADHVDTNLPTGSRHGADFTSRFRLDSRIRYKLSGMTDTQTPLVLEQTIILLTEKLLKRFVTSDGIPTLSAGRVGRPRVPRIPQCVWDALTMHSEILLANRRRPTSTLSDQAPWIGAIASFLFVQIQQLAYMLTLSIQLPFVLLPTRFPANPWASNS